MPPYEWSLGLGWPAVHLLPAALVSEAAQAVLSDPPTAWRGLLYGPNEGHPPLRQALASWLGEFYKQDVQAERLTITGGASQNLGCILQVFTDLAYTQNVFMVAPSYMMIYPAIHDAGFTGRMVAVPEDEGGIDIAYLRKRLEESEARRSQEPSMPNFKPKREYSKYYRYVIYCVPTFANPSSRVMSHDRRVELVKIAREFDALVICDDVYDQLLWSADPTAPVEPIKHAILPRVVDIDKTLDGGASRDGADGFGNVVSNGSFSKICGPGVRVGWAEGSPRFAHGLSMCGTTTSGGAPSQLASTFMTKLLVDGSLQAHIFNTVQPAYASRYKTMMKAIEDHLVPLGVTLPQEGREVIGGYFIWFKLPGELSGKEYAERCQRGPGITIIPGNDFEIPGDSRVQFPHHIRICFTWVAPAKIAPAIESLGKVLREMIEESGSHSPVRL